MNTNDLFKATKAQIVPIEIVEILSRLLNSNRDQAILDMAK